MLVRLYEDGDWDRWQRFVAVAPDTTLYHDVRWKGVVERSFGHPTYYLLALDDAGAVAGLLPLVHLRSRLFGNFFVSLPFFTYGGVCGDPRQARPHLVQRAAEVARDLGASHIELRHSEPTCGELPAKAEKVSMRLPLPGDVQELWTRLPAKLRSQVRRAEKAGVTVRVGRFELLDAFYRVFAENMRDLGTPVYGKRFFAEILEAFPEASICGAYLGGEPVAGGVVIGFRDSLEIPWASARRRFNPSSPNMLLYWTALRFAVERGYRVFDFGRCTRDEGTYRFKAQWGARPVALYWHYWLGTGGVLPRLDPRNPRYRLAIRVWRRLPVFLTRAVGPAIVKNLP